MKRKIMPMMAMALFLVPLLNSCEKDKKENVPQLDGNYAVDLSDQGLDWDYMIVNDQGNYVLAREEGGIPTSIFVKPTSSHDGYTILVDEYGLPSKMVIDDFVFLFDNFNGTKADVAVVSPDGGVEIFREVEGQVNWDEAYTKGALEAESWSSTLNIVSHVTGGVSCLAGITATAMTAGAGWPLTVLGCSGFAIGLAAENWPEHELLGLGAAEVGAISTILGCVNPTDLAGKIGCFAGITSTATTVASWGAAAIENSQDDVWLAEATLLGGYGDIQITLAWDNTADLDLHVVDPNGEEIYWSHAYSSSGGYLDYDNIEGYGPENVFWEDGQAPSGVYDVYVHHYDWDDAGYPQSSNFEVLISAFGFTEQFSGSTTFNETVFVASFDKSGLVSTVKKAAPVMDESKPRKAPGLRVQ